MGLVCERNVNERHVIPEQAELLPISYEGKDVYNPSVPSSYDGVDLMFGRVESRDREDDTKTVLFTRNEHGVWTPVEGACTYDMQDPFIEIIQGKWVLEGVKVNWEGGCFWHTDFYVGKNPYELHKFAQGPMGMKDIRPVELRNGRIGIFTRPQGGDVFELGKIGYCEVDELLDINEDTIARAPLIADQFEKGAWGGVNQARELPNGRIGVIYHYARFVGDARKKKYEIWSLEYDPETNECFNKGKLAERSDFPETPAKRPDLFDITFPAGIVACEDDDSSAILYSGLSDTSIGTKRIPYPFGSESLGLAA